MIIATITERIITSAPSVIGILACLLFILILLLPGKGKRQKRVSELEEVFNPSGDDYLLISDMSEQKSCKLRLDVLKKYIKS